MIFNAQFRPFWPTILARRLCGVLSPDRRAATRVRCLGHKPRVAFRGEIVGALSGQGCKAPRPTAIPTSAIDPL
jgi:hypothetical protein